MILLKSNQIVYKFLDFIFLNFKKKRSGKNIMGEKALKNTTAKDMLRGL